MATVIQTTPQPAPRASAPRKRKSTGKLTAAVAALSSKQKSKYNKCKGAGKGSWKCIKKAKTKSTPWKWLKDDVHPNTYFKVPKAGHEYKIVNGRATFPKMKAEGGAAALAAALIPTVQQLQVNSTGAAVAQATDAINVLNFVKNAPQAKPLSPIPESMQRPVANPRTEKEIFFSGLTPATKRSRQMIVAGAPSPSGPTNVNPNIEVE